MDFGSIGGLGGGIGGAAAGYLATPDGKAAITKYLGSQEGIALLQNFASTPEGQKAIMAVLNGMNLPPGTADTIKSALGSQQAPQQ